MRHLFVSLILLLWLWSAGFAAAATQSMVIGLLVFAACPLALVFVPLRRYDTLSDNCSSAIRDHVNRFAAAKVPYDTRVLFPARADEFLIERGHAIGAASLEEARRLYPITGKAKEAGNDPFFSWRIRGLAAPELPMDSP